jgi:serpin B
MQALPATRPRKWPRPCTSRFLPRDCTGPTTPSTWPSRPASDLTAAALPYQDTRLSLLVVVPRPGAFDQVEASLDGSWLDGLVASLTLQSATVQLPRFAVSTNAPVKDALVALGMQAAFQPGVADFSGIDGSRFLVIQDVLHKAFIAVGETGTEAAAATGVPMGGGRPPISLVADRPFFYFLRDEPTGAILFMGRVVDPTQ